MIAASSQMTTISSHQRERERERQRETERERGGERERRVREIDGEKI